MKKIKYAIWMESVYKRLGNYCGLFDFRNLYYSENRRLYKNQYPVSEYAHILVD